MVTIHEQNVTNFSNIGLGTLLPSSCVVKEELNGLFELELYHPYDEWGKWQRIENSRIIAAETPRGRQPFRIYRVSPTLGGITVCARHIFYDLLDNFIQSVTITDKTASEALVSIKNSFDYEMPFKFSAEFSDTGSIKAENVNAVAALMGNDDDKDSFIKTYGGEILRNGFNVSFVPSVGTDKGVQIRYSKNLVGLDVDEDISEVVTRIYPIGKDGLKGDSVDSQYLSRYTYPKIGVFENTELETKNQLAAYAQSLFEEGVDLPKINIKVSFQLLSKTAEYKDFAVLEDIQLGDVVTVINSKIGFNKKAKVISYEWDCLLNKYNEVELGDFVADITSSITNGEKAVDTANSASTAAKQVYSIINSGVTIVDNTLYICVDGTEYTTAQKLFKFGSNGLEYSSSGINGAWTTIINSDGQVI